MIPAQPRERNGVHPSLMGPLSLLYSFYSLLFLSITFLAVLPNFAWDVYFSNSPHLHNLLIPFSFWEGIADCIEIIKKFSTHHPGGLRGSVAISNVRGILALILISTGLFLEYGLRTIETWPFRLFRFGAAYAMTALFAFGFSFHQINLSPTKGYAGITLSAALVLISLVIPALFLGGIVWACQEIRGRRFYEDPSSMRLYPLLWKSGRGSLYEPKPREERILEELIQMRKRSRSLSNQLLITALLFTLLLFTQSSFIQYWVVIAIYLNIGLLVKFLINERAYRWGAAFIEGAFVKDNTRETGNRERVFQQKAHGESEKAQEDETEDLLNQKGDL